jgi:hypothetical protein
MTTRVDSLNRELQTFAVELFERSGGVAEWSSPEDLGSVVVPPALAASAHLPGEEFSLSAAAAPQGLHVSLASDFLDVASRTLAVAVPRDGAFCIAQRHLTSRDLTEKITRSFVWQNSRATCGAAQPALAAYHVWLLHGSLRSEDVWDGTFRICVNEESGATVELPDLFQELDLVGDETGQAPSPPSTYGTAIVEGKRRLMAASSEFVRRMDQRLERDRKRLQDYYRALSREADGAKRAVAAPSAEEVAAKKRAVDLELRRKLTELNESYVLHAEVRPVSVARFRLPVLIVPVVIQRKQASRDYRLYWNSLIKGFEPLACCRCRRATFSATFTNETVDLLCTPCATA